MRTLPIGVENFNAMITKNCEYVDKTLFIKEIIEKNVGTTLFLRPRRFGKTLMLSMLETYLSVQDKEMNKDLFHGLNVSKCEEKITSCQGVYPVINISLKELKAKTWDENYEDLKGLISELYQKNSFLLERLQEHDIKYFNRILNLEGTKTDVKQSLLKLTRMLYNYYNKKVVVLIDEYDTVYETSYVNGSYEKCKEIINPLLGNVLKTNSYLEFSVMTGILRISKESILSELNHLNVCSVKDEDYDNYFGFNEKEVEELLEKYEMTDKKEEVAKWYNGYKFGENKIYNPWSIINFLSKKGTFSDYWVNTSSNRVLSKVIMGATEDVYKVLQQLIEGESVEISYTENTVYSELKSGLDTIISFLLMSGYVTEDENKKASIEDNIFVKVPNYEVKKALKKMVTGVFEITGASTFLNQFKNAVLKDNKELMQNALKDLLERSISYFDNIEAFYHGVILGLLISLGDEYIIDSNRESGLRKI